MPVNIDICIISPPGYIHSQAFYPLARALYEALGELGHIANITTQITDTRNKTIVLGAHLVAILPHDWIIFNTEQIGEGFANQESYIALLKRHEVWDYSHLNISKLYSLGIVAKYCGIGYSPCLSRIEEKEPEIDILFYGSLNKRRQKILNDIGDVHVAFGIYEEDLDALIAKSKIILNIHYYDSKIWEIVRCSYLMANKKCIISESGEDKQLESTFSDAVQFCSYDDIPTVCHHYLKNPHLIGYKSTRGFEIFSSMKQANYLKAVLG